MVYILESINETNIFRKFFMPFICKLIPDKLFLKIRFWGTFGYILDLTQPRTFNEKLQWKKLFDNPEQYSLYVDKYKIKNIIAKKIGKKYVIPLIYFTKNPDSLKKEWNKFPKKFVIKSTHGSGQIIIVNDKNEIDLNKVIITCKNWLKTQYYSLGKEYQYKNIIPSIIIEKLILEKKGHVPNDYKFHCFDGQVEFIQVDTDRFEKHRRSIFDINWKKMSFSFGPQRKRVSMYKEANHVKKPKKLTQMIKLAETLSKDFNYVRVDLYFINNKIYFGELTFTPESGFGKFVPEKYDLIYGEKLKLNKTL